MNHPTLWVTLSQAHKPHSPCLSSAWQSHLPGHVFTRPATARGVNGTPSSGHLNGGNLRNVMIDIDQPSNLEVFLPAKSLASALCLDAQNESITENKYINCAMTSMTIPV
jgi:hypothetical protein